MFDHSFASRILTDYLAVSAIQLSIASAKRKLGRPSDEKKARLWTRPFGPARCDSIGGLGFGGPALGGETYLGFVLFMHLIELA
jgi:hypothetical protein